MLECTHRDQGLLLPTLYLWEDHFPFIQRHIYHSLSLSQNIYEYLEIYVYINTESPHLTSSVGSVTLNETVYIIKPILP